MNPKPQMELKILKLLENCKSVGELKQAHLQTIVNDLQGSSLILPKLVTLSSHLDSLDHAIKVFQSSECLSLIAYNTMIKCFIGKTHKGAVQIYNHMKALRMGPNSFTFTFLLRCFEPFEAVKDGMQVHGEIVKLGFCTSQFVTNTLLDFYAKCCANLDFARRMFEEMPQRDVVSWNTMIGAYMASGEIESAIALFDSMTERNIVTWNSVVSGLSKAGNMKLACSVFEKMPQRNEVSWNAMISGYVRVGDIMAAQSIFNQIPWKNETSWTTLISGYTRIGDLESASNIFYRMPVKTVVSWNAMISGHVHNHMFDQALNVFQQMLMDGKCKPDQSTLISVLSACSHLGSVDQGKWIDSYIKKNKFDLSIPLGNALMDMFAKCGDVESAKEVFNRMANRCIITWTTIISGLAVHGHSREALDLFNTMCAEGMKPDDVIFIAVLSACSHGGLVEEGKKVFDQMVNAFGIEPRIEHYGCMIDLLGRAGKLEEAVGFIENMHLKPNAVIWATLLGSCKIHGNGELLDSVTRKILDQEPSNPNYLLLISNLSASIGQWEGSLSYRMAMRHRGIEKVPGCSSIQVGNSVHEFVAKDIRHEERKGMYDILHSMNRNLKAEWDTLCEFHEFSMVS